MNLICGDALAELKKMEAQSVHCCVTSPPYWGLRDYGTEGQLGLEKTPEEYTAKMVELFGEVRRVLRDDGTLWLNLGDSYISQGGFRTYGSHDKNVGRGYNSGMRCSSDNLKTKDLVGIPWRVAFALQADGWYLRSDIIWAKPNPMPESVTDRPTKAHEYIFLLSKASNYYYDADAIREITGNEASPEEYKKLDGRVHFHDADLEKGMSQHNPNRKGVTHPYGRNKRTIWEVATHPFPDAHFATFPLKLIQPCVLAGCPAGGMVLDPFAGSGTTGIVAINEGRDFVGIELNPEYVEMAKARIKKETAQQRMFV